MSDKKLFVKVAPSKKDNTKNYCALCLDLGYRVAYLSFDKLLICDLLAITLAECYTLAVGTYEVK